MKQEEFKTEYTAVLARALTLAEKARREGRLSLAGEIDKTRYYQRDVFEYGLWLVTEGTDIEIIDTILLNIIKQETDSDRKTLAEIKKEAVFAIDAGYDKRMTALLLNSHVGTGLDDVLQEYGMRDEKKTGPEFRELLCPHCKTSTMIAVGYTEKPYKCSKCQGLLEADTEAEEGREND